MSHTGIASPNRTPFGLADKVQAKVQLHDSEGAEGSGMAAPDLSKGAQNWEAVSVRTFRRVGDGYRVPLSRDRTCLAPTCFSTHKGHARRIRRQSALPGTTSWLPDAYMELL